LDNGDIRSNIRKYNCDVMTKLYFKKESFNVMALYRVSQLNLSEFAILYITEINTTYNALQAYRSGQK